MLSVDERSASSTPCCAARLKGRRPRGGCALARLPALRAFLCWRAGEIWARRPCSVLLSGSASSTPCGGCCDLQAVLEPIGRCWASCIARGQSVEELDATRGGDEAGRLRMRAGAGCDAGGLFGCGCASWHRSEHALAYTYASALPRVGPTLAAVGGVSFSAAGITSLSKHRAASVVPP